MMRLPLLDANDQTSVDMEQVCKMVDTFLSRGFTYFDTAYMYHACQSEIVVREALVKKAYSVTYGARNLRRTIQKELEDPISEKIIDSFEHPISTIHIAVIDGAVTLTTN